MQSKFWSLALLTLCEVAALGVWFSASAVIPSIEAEMALTAWYKSLLTSSVQAGFVAGTLTSAYLGLADRLDPRRFFAACALTAAICNAVILVAEITSPLVIAMRFLTGACMAGVYPVGMKIATTWARRDMGFLVGILVGGVTLGTGAPHLFNAFGGVDWRFTITIASIAALGAAILVNLVGLGPNIKPAAPFDPKAALRGFQDKALRYANFGYLGHMWELYAVWAWLVIFLEASFALNPGGGASELARLTAFGAIGLGGAFGCIAGGWIADRTGRTALTIAAMTMSGACCALIGFLFGASPAILIAVCVIWGIAIVADSAQFSTSIAELAPPDRIGTMLTVQTCAGFLLTLVTIHAIPFAVEWLGWRYAFVVLVPGPLFGVIAMIALRRHPDAVKIAGGRR